MELKCKYKVKFAVTMDNGYEIDIKYLKRFFTDNTIIGVINRTDVNVNNIPFFNMGKYQSDHTIFLKYFVDILLLERVENSVLPQSYKVLDYKIFIDTLTEVGKFYKESMKNRDAYKREFIIDNILQ